jgi:Tol biopolymer transport system component
MIGKTISHYKITEHLGGGGMGIVYKAEDTRLDRFVALKFLPPGFGRDEEEKQRFIHEAKAASALDHQNICVIFDINETDDGQLYIAMACYDGETLKKKIERGNLKVDAAIDLAIQVAEGLTQAHQKDIIHRDIKPANILVTEQGVVKIVDFGLAKLAGQTKLTKATTTLGTAAYMSPEQTRGDEVDPRSDIWSFGVVLYEMLTGQLPFKGDYDQAVMYSILNEEPEPVTSLRTGIPLELERVIDKALEKEKEDRYQHADEMLVDLRRVKRDTSRVSRKHLIQTPDVVETPAARPQPTGKTSLRKFFLPVIILSAVILGIIAIVLLRPFSRQSPAGPMKTTRFTSYPGEERHPAFSPDGNHITFVWDGEAGDNSDIYVKTIGAGQYTPLQITDHTNAELSPAWSPDGRFIAFQRIERTSPGRFIVEGRQSHIYQVPALGGNARQITTGFQPDWSPDGKFLALCDWDSVEVRALSIFLYSFDNRERRKLSQPPPNYNDYHPAISPDGERLAFLRSAGIGHASSEEIYIMPVSVGEPRQITFDNVDIKGLAWTLDSRDLIFSSVRGGPHTLWRISTSGGEPEPVTSGGELSFYPAISPDGHRLAYVKSEISPGSGTGEKSIWRYEIPKEEGQIIPPEKLIYSGSHYDQRAVYSPRGERIVFQSLRSGTRELWLCDKNGHKAIQLTTFGGPRVANPRWSPDSKSVVFSASPEGHSDIFTISIEGRQVQRLTFKTSQEDYPSWSRDGRWIYFTRNSEGSVCIYKVPAEGGEMIQVTTVRGHAFESPDGRWLYYSNRHDENSYLYRVPTAGGKASLVFQFKHISDFALFADGIYFHGWDEKDGGTVQFYDFATQKTEKIMPLQGSRQGYMDVSPDRRYILCTHREEPESDIMLVDNWR